MTESSEFFAGKESTGESDVFYPFEFKGTVSGFFRIWITNTALTLVTLGIYSAWAKVRTRRYIFGNTQLDGMKFDYHGDARQILKGRILLVSILAAYFLGPYIYPLLSTITSGLALLLTPWIIVRAQVFNRGNTSYRGIRFKLAPHRVQFGVSLSL
jgi:uncharacterized membrane protein YjgN (DUF898 family)